MIDEQRLKVLYQHELKDTLQGMEASRKLIAWSLAGGFTGFFLNLIAFFITSFAFSRDLGYTPLIAVIGGISLATAIFGALKHAGYSKTFKTRVIARVIHVLNPEWTYSQQHKIGFEDFRKSNLIRVDYHRYESDDLVNGTIGGTPFKCSSIKLKDEPDHKSNMSEGHLFFNGLLLQIDVDKQFNGHTYITPYEKDKTDVEVYIDLDKKEQAGKIATDYPEFSERFMVHATHPQTQVLNAELAAAIAKTCHFFEQDIHLSFIGSKVHCVIDYETKDRDSSLSLFEPTVFGSRVKYENIKFLYDVFLLIETVVLVLNKNNKIWLQE